jgi:hypothetical protein
MQNVKIKQPGIRSWIKGGISISVNSDISVVAYALTSLIIISSIIIQTVFSPGPILVSAYQGNPVISGINSQRKLFSNTACHLQELHELML